MAYSPELWIDVNVYTSFSKKVLKPPPTCKLYKYFKGNLAVMRITMGVQEDDPTRCLSASSVELQIH